MHERIRRPPEPAASKIVISKKTPGVIEALLAQLKDKDRCKSNRAFFKIIEIGTNAIPALLKAAAEGDSRSISVLSSIVEKNRKSEGVEKLVPFFAGLLLSDDIMERTNALNALAAIGPKSVEPLIGVLSDKDVAWYVRGCAAIALGQITDKRATEPLITVLNDKSEHLDVRKHAAGSLSMPLEERAISALLKIMGDHNEQPALRDEAGDSLSSIARDLAEYLESGEGIKPDPKFKELLFSSLKGIVERGDEFGVIKACEVLGFLWGEESAARVLVGALSQESRFVRAQAVASLEYFHPNRDYKDRRLMRRAMLALVKALGDRELSVRFAAAGSLEELMFQGGLKDRKIKGMMIRPLISLMVESNDDHLEEKYSVKSALVAVGKQAVPALSRVLQSGSDDARSFAASILAEVGGQKAIRALKKARKDPSEEVRDAVSYALENLKR